LQQLPLNWAEILALASRHRVEALLHRNLASLDGTVPFDSMSQLQNAVRLRTVSSLARTAQLIELDSRFQSEGLAAQPFRGPLLAQWAYGNIMLRPSQDLDFVLQQREIGRAAELLIRAGYQAEIDPATAVRPIRKGSPGQFCFFPSAPASCMVELHTEVTMRYFPIPLNLDDMRRRPTRIVVGGRELTTFSPEETLIMLCVHGAKHFWNRLLWLCDVSELVQAPPAIDWDFLERTSARMGCRRLLLLGLSLAADYLDAPLPADILRAIHTDPGIPILQRRVEAHLFSSQTAEPGSPERLLIRLLSNEDFGQGLRQLARVITRPSERDWQTYDLPAWASPFYALLRPWRLLRAYGLGLGRPRSRPVESRAAQTENNGEKTAL
jgi:hypothetical protein